MRFVFVLAFVAISAIPSSDAARSKSREKLPIKEEEVTGLGASADSRLSTINSADGQQGKASGKFCFIFVVVIISLLLLLLLLFRCCCNNCWCCEYFFD